MANLNLSVDTVTQEISVTVDGVVVTNPSWVSLYNMGEDDKPRFVFTVEERSKSNGVYTTTRMEGTHTAFLRPAATAAPLPPKTCRCAFRREEG